MYILRMKAAQSWVIFLNACLSCALFNSIDSLRFMVKSRGQLIRLGLHTGWGVRAVGGLLKCSAKLLTSWNTWIVCVSVNTLEVWEDHVWENTSNLQFNETRNYEMLSTQKPLYMSQRTQEKATNPLHIWPLKLKLEGLRTSWSRVRIFLRCWIVTFKVCIISPLVNAETTLKLLLNWLLPPPLHSTIIPPDSTLPLIIQLWFHILLWHSRSR